MAVKFAGLMSGALAAAIKQLVLAGLPTTHVLMFLLACLFMALPTAEKMAPLSCGAMSYLSQRTRILAAKIQRFQLGKRTMQVQDDVHERGAAMRCENAAADLEQVTALHARSTGLGANKAREVGTVESNLGRHKLLNSENRSGAMEGMN
jgi:hypothetical protein